MPVITGYFGVLVVGMDLGLFFGFEGVLWGFYWYSDGLKTIIFYITRWKTLGTPTPTTSTKGGTPSNSVGNHMG